MTNRGSHGTRNYERVFVSNDTAIETEEIESQQFREALLVSLNGQTEDVHRLIKLVDRRFQSHARRMREHRQEHLRDRRRLERYVIGALTAAPSVTLGIVKGIEVLT